MPAPTPGDVHVDGLLTGFSVGYIQNQNMYVADMVFERMPVNHQSDKWATFTKADFLRSDMQRRGIASASATISYGTGSTRYTCEDWALKIPVDDRTVANADDPYNPLQNATKLLTQKELMKREQEFASNFMTTGKWGTDVTGGTDFEQWSAVDSDPVGDISTYKRTVRRSTGLDPNDLVINDLIWDSLRNHPDILSRVISGGGPSSPATLTRQAVAAVLGVERIHVSSAIVNTAEEGVTASYDTIVSENALLCYVDQNPGEMTPTAGLTFVWNKYIGSDEGRRIKRWRDEEIESEYVEIQANWDQKIIAADCGVLLASAAA